MHFTPGAIVVEVGVTHHVLRHVAQRHRAVEALVAVKAKAVEVVRTRDVVDLVVPQGGIEEADRLAVAHGEIGVVAIGRAAAVPHRHRGVAALRIDVDTVLARPRDGEGQGRRVDFVHLVLVEPAHAQVQCALGELHLGGAIVEVQQLQAGALVHAQRRAAQLQLGAGVAVGPQAVAADQRPVERGHHPVVLARRREADVAAQVAHACHAAGRVGIVVGADAGTRGCAGGERERQDEAEKRGHVGLPVGVPGTMVGPPPPLHARVSQRKHAECRPAAGSGRPCGANDAQRAFRTAATTAARIAARASAMAKYALSAGVVQW